jgi:acyl-CoA synthetase (NDP forming)
MRFFSREQLDRALNARSMVVVGAKRDGNFTWLRRLANFKGKLYAVHVNPESIREIEAMGISCYRSVAEVPGPVDYVQVTAPRSAAVEIFRQCIEAKAGAVSYFTSGFAETDAKGRELQDTLSQLSRKSAIPLIGPNGLGFYNGLLGITTTPDMPTGEAGPVGIVSQSGTHNSSFIKYLYGWHGIHTRYGVSLGNACVLDAADWVEYMGEKDEVKVLAVYVEDIGDPARFRDAVRKVVARKPVVIWKGGNTVDGARVINSHTGAKPTTAEDWARILRESGATGVESLKQLIDSVAFLVRFPKLRGPRGGVLILTGGQGIEVTDMLCRNGLRVPELSKQSLDELASFFDPIGGSYHNPLDAAYTIETPALLARQLGILDRDPNTDFVTMDLYGVFMSPQRLTSTIGLFGTSTAEAGSASYLDVLVRHARSAAKPFFMTVTAGVYEAEGLELRRLLNQQGLLCFPSIERAAVAYAKALAAQNRL